jgi:uncharacterized protein (DUF427 family)
VRTSVIWRPPWEWQAKLTRRVRIYAVGAPEHEEWIPSPRRVRVRFNDAWIADSSRMMLLRQHGFLPVYYFPEADIRTDLLEPSEHTTYSPYKGTASYWDVAVGDRRARSAAWTYREPKPGSPDTRAYYSFDFHSMDAWFEEDEQIYVHARDPHLRVDTLRSSRHVQVVIDGVTVADTHSPVLLLETGLVTRYYVPPLDVRMDLLEPSDTFTMCPYKGRASYYSLRIDGKLHEDAAWYYPRPLRDVRKVENLLCFWNERVDALIVDGEPLPKREIRDGGEGGELLYPSRRFFAVPPPESMKGAGVRQHEHSRPNNRAEGPPDELMDMAVERAGGREWL